MHCVYILATYIRPAHGYLASYVATVASVQMHAYVDMHAYMRTW